MHSSPIPDVHICFIVVPGLCSIMAMLEATLVMTFLAACWGGARTHDKRHVLLEKYCHEQIKSLCFIYMYGVERTTHK